MTHNRDELQADLYHAAINCNYDKLRAVLSRRGNPNTYFGDKYNNNKTNILCLACERGLAESVRILLDAGGYGGLQDRWGQTPLMYACYSQYADVVDLLLSRQAEIMHIQDNKGKTALHCALESASVDCVTLLLKYGCDFDKITHAGVTPLMTLMQETPSGELEMLLQLLIKAGVNLETEEFRYSRTALQIAVIKKNVTAVRILISVGVRINVLDVNGRTPLTNLIFHNGKRLHISKRLDGDIIQILDMLITSGADINMAESRDCNPLIMSASVMAEPFVRFLLEKGADPNIIVPSGVTALHVAVMKMDLLTAKTLVQWSAKINLKGRIWLTDEEKHVDSFDLAIENASWEIVKMFVNTRHKANRDKYFLEYDSTSVPDPSSVNKEMLAWLQEKLSNPCSLFHSVLLTLWRILKSDTESKLDQINIPVQFKQTLLSGDFLTS